jgi:hypothetical protein
MKLADSAILNRKITIFNFLHYNRKQSGQWSKNGLTRECHISSVLRYGFFLVPLFFAIFQADLLFTMISDVYIA